MQKQLILFPYLPHASHNNSCPSVSMRYLYEKYSSSQNYYHTILITNITQRKYKHESIMFEDLQQYNNCSQYLKRTYSKAEYHNKYSAFKQYYFYHQDCPRIYGNPHIDDIYETWHEKKRDLVYKKLNIFDQSVTSLQTTMKPEQRTKNKVNKSNLLLNISQYNPKSNKYYLKLTTHSHANTCTKNNSKRNTKSNRIETNQSVRVCKNMNKDISRMLVQVNNDLSDITNMNISLKTQQNCPQSQWDGTVNGNKNEIEFNNRHGRSQSDNVEQNKQGQKLKNIIKSLGLEKKQKDLRVTKKNIPKQDTIHQNNQQSKSKFNKQIQNNLYKKQTKFDILEQNYDDLRSSNKTQQGKVKSILLISDNNRLNKNFSQKIPHNNPSNNNKNYQNPSKAIEEVKVQNNLKRSESFSPRKSYFKQQRIINQVNSVKKIKLSHQQNILNRSPGKNPFIQKLPTGKNRISKNAIAKNTEILEPINKIKQTNRGPNGLTQNNRQLSLNKKQHGVQQFSDTKIVNDFPSYKSEFLPPNKSLATLRPSQDFNPENKFTIKLKSKDLKLEKRNFEKQIGIKSPQKQGKDSESKISLNVPSLANRYFNK